MNKLLIIVLCAFLAACGEAKDTPKSHEVTDFDLPKGMEGCRKFYVVSNNGSWQAVWRCPNSTTTSSNGKFAPSVVADGN